MSWIPLDDGFHSHRKVVTAGLEAVGLHCRVLSWCGASLTDGYVPAALVREFAGARAARLAQRLVDAGLWERDDDGWRVHNWQLRNASAQSIRAERGLLSEKRRRAGAAGAKVRWRKGQTDLNCPDGKMANGMANAWQTAWQTDSKPMAPVQGLSPRLRNVQSSPWSDARAGREDQESPGQDLFGAVRAARERAGRTSTWWHNSALEVALEVARNSHPKLQPRELELALLTIASWPDTKSPKRLVHVVDKALREATQSNGQRQAEPLPPLPPTVAELRARGDLP